MRHEHLNMLLSLEIEPITALKPGPGSAESLLRYGWI
jgi:hypothetical protein